MRTIPTNSKVMITTPTITDVIKIDFLLFERNRCGNYVVIITNISTDFWYFYPTFVLASR